MTCEKSNRDSGKDRFTPALFQNVNVILTYNKTVKYINRVQLISVQNYFYKIYSLQK